MRPLFGMSQDYYDLSRGGPAERAFLVIVRRTHDIGEQAQATAGQMVDMRAEVEHTERMTHEVVRDYQACQTTLEARLRATEHHLARLQGASTSSAPLDPSRRN